MLQSEPESTQELLQRTGGARVASTRTSLPAPPAARGYRVSLAKPTGAAARIANMRTNATALKQGTALDPTRIRVAGSATGIAPPPLPAPVAAVKPALAGVGASRIGSKPALAGVGASRIGSKPAVSTRVPGLPSTNLVLNPAAPKVAGPAPGGAGGGLIGLYKALHAQRQPLD